MACWNQLHWDSGAHDDEPELQSPAAIHHQSITIIASLFAAIQPYREDIVPVGGRQNTMTPAGLFETRPGDGGNALIAHKNLAV